MKRDLALGVNRLASPGTPLMPWVTAKASTKGQLAVGTYLPQEAQPQG